MPTVLAQSPKFLLAVALLAGCLFAAPAFTQSAPSAADFAAQVAIGDIFEIESGNPLWKGMDRSAGLSLHVAGDFPGLEMALWAIRNR